MSNCNGMGIKYNISGVIIQVFSYFLMYSVIIEKMKTTLNTLLKILYVYSKKFLLKTLKLSTKAKTCAFDAL